MADQFDFSAMVRDPARVDAIPVSDIPTLLTQLSALQTAMAARLIAGHDETADSDTMLTVEQAAQRLGVSPDWLYRRTKVLPFVVRLGRHVRFSAQGIERFLRSRVGRR